MNAVTNEAELRNALSDVYITSADVLEQIKGTAKLVEIALESPNFALQSEAIAQAMKLIGERASYAIETNDDIAEKHGIDTLVDADAELRRCRARMSVIRSNPERAAQ